MQLKTTAEFIDEIKVRQGLVKDADVARRLGITSSSVSQLRNLKNTFDDSTALKVAELLGTDPGYVVLCAHAQGAKRPEVRTVWEHIARAASTAATVLIGLGFFAGPDASNAALRNDSQHANNIHYAKWLKRFFRRRAWTWGLA